MIDINLVPEQLRKKRRAQPVMIVEEVQSGLPKETIFLILGVFTGLLIVILVVLQFYVASLINKRNDLKGQMSSIESDRTAIEKTIKEMKDLKAKVKTFEKVIGTHTVIWAEKLNEISDQLPRSIWLSKVALEANSLIIEGSAVSKTKTEIADIHALTGKLKASKVFMSNLKELELEQIKTRTQEILPVADFKIKAELKEKKLETSK